MTSITPALLKVKWIFTLVKLQKLHAFLVSGSDICLWEGHRVSQKYLRKRKRLGQRKLILVALRTNNNALTFQHDYPAASHHCKDSSKTMSAVNSKLLTVLQEVNLHRGAERFPDEVCCPLHVRHFLILLVCCRNVVKFEWAPTDFF